jgi:hypothetical protein
VSSATVYKSWRTSIVDWRFKPSGNNPIAMGEWFPKEYLPSDTVTHPVRHE